MVWPQIWPLLIIRAITLPLGLKIFDWARRCQRAEVAPQRMTLSRYRYLAQRLACDKRR
jgi:hypothetical protein